MTYQEKDRVLRQYRENAIRLRGLVQEAERWEQIAMSTAISGEPSSGGGNTGGRVQTAALSLPFLRNHPASRSTAAARRGEWPLTTSAPKLSGKTRYSVLPSGLFCLKPTRLMHVPCSVSMS